MFQISFELPDRTGELSKVVSLLSEREIDLKALCVTRPGCKGESVWVKLIPTNLEATMTALAEGGLAPVKEEVLIVAHGDEPGALGAVLGVLAAAEIDLGHAYSCVSRLDGRAMSVLEVSDPGRGRELLRSKGFAVAVADSEDDARVDPSELMGGVWYW